MQNLDSLGFDAHFLAQFEQLAEAGQVCARVITEGKGQFLLGGIGAPVQGRCAGRLKSATQNERPAVGDWVYGKLTGELLVIEGILARKTTLLRKVAGDTSASQVVATNVDCVFVVDSAVAPNWARIERYVAAILAGGAEPVLLMNKADLCPDHEGLAAELDTLFPKFRHVIVSALGERTVEILSSHLQRGTTSVLVGSSGVGKSTLVNVLLGAARQETGEVQDDDGKGRHTTTARRLFQLPNGALIIDTPGMREFGLIDARRGVDELFDDITALAETCHFTDCKHAGEPGCAVQRAIEAGEIDGRRLSRLHKLERELAFNDRRHDEQARQGERKRWKAIGKSVRQRRKLNSRLGLKSD